MDKKSTVFPLINAFPQKPLFHYTTAAGLMGIIESKKIWTTKIHYLNDKLELKLAFDLIRDEIQQQLVGKVPERNRTDEELNNMLEVLDGIQLFNVSVASFTENGDQLSQWRGYSEVGNGYSLGFDGMRLWGNVMNYKGVYYLAPCVYEEEKQREMVRELISLTSVVNIKQNPNYGKPPFYKMAFGEAALVLAPLIKDKGFAEEGEWRLISVPLKYENAKFRSGNYSLIPYWEFELDVDVFTSIIIGPTPEPTLSESAVYGLLQRHGVSFLINGVSHSKISYRKI